MAVFPEQMDKLDLNDTPGSLRRIENYIRYMTERMEFSNRNTTRTVTDAGISSVGLYNDVVDLTNVVAALLSQVSSIRGTITGMGTQMTNLSTQVTALTEQISDLISRVETLEGGTENGSGL